MAEPQRLSLMDIGPLTEKVPYGENYLQVHGISTEGIFRLFERFPDMQAWLSGAGLADPAQTLLSAPGAIAAIIVAASDAEGSIQAEKNASGLPIEIQLDLLEAIGRLTFRSGFGPFVQRIAQLAAVVAVVARSGRDTGTNSRRQSTTSLETATPSTPSGS